MKNTFFKRIGQYSLSALLIAMGFLLGMALIQYVL